MFFLDSLARRVIYQPSPPDDSLAEPPRSDDAFPPLREVWIDTPDQHRLHAWFAEYPGAERGLLFCHGNAGHLAHRAHNVMDFRKRFRSSVLIFDYRGFGRSRGVPEEQGVCMDAEAAWQSLLTEAGLEPSQITLFGRSLGAAIAVETARRVGDYAALLLASPFTGIAAMCAALVKTELPSRYLSERFDSIAKIAALTRPLMIVHGRRDSLIPIAQGQRLFAEARADIKRWHEVIAADHNDLLMVGGEPLFAAIEAFLDEAYKAHNKSSHLS